MALALRVTYSIIPAADPGFRVGGGGGGGGGGCCRFMARYEKRGGAVGFLSVSGPIRREGGGGGGGGYGRVSGGPDIVR